MYITPEKINLNQFFSFPPDPGCGAQSSFVGMVRNQDHGRPVEKLFYECYWSMANRNIDKLIQETKNLWPVHGIRVLHRVGMLEIGDVAVVIAVSAAHRDEAFLACRFLIEGIKREIPIWKKQIFQDGSAEWTVCSHSFEGALQ